MLPTFTILTCDPSIYPRALPVLYCNYIRTLRFFFFFFELCHQLVNYHWKSSLLVLMMTFVGQARVLCSYLVFLHVNSRLFDHIVF